MTGQQIADEALALWQSHKGDDQEKIDSILREFFSREREEDRKAEFKRQMSCIYVEFPCVITNSITTSVSPSPSSDHF